MIIYPILSAVVSTVFVTQPDGASTVSMASYRFFFSDHYSCANLWITLWTTLVCGMLLLASGLPIALYLRFFRGRLPAYLHGVAIFPMFVPSITLSYALIRTMGPNGAVDVLLNAVGAAEAAVSLLDAMGSDHRSGLG